MRALPRLAECPSLARTLCMATGVAPPPMARPCREDVHALDPGARPLARTELLVLTVALRSLSNWMLPLIAAPGRPIPRQSASKGREEVTLVSLLGAEGFLVEISLAASVDPAVPRLTVLVPPLSVVLGQGAPPEDPDRGARDGSGCPSVPRPHPQRDHRPSTGPRATGSLA